ncbi:MAG: hypothetical protein J6Y02_00810 [Pseudobutyrivibrio sp.]|nr:hypothetical protein [Pseudobutyrivibrio sp.]
MSSTSTKRIIIEPFELYDEGKEQFIRVDKRTEIVLCHSLVSVAKWEAKWKRPYLSNEPMTVDMTLDYIKCMTISQNVDPKVYYGLTPANIEEIKQYIEDPMTATTFNGNPNETASRSYSREKITSELIYYLMTANNIPVEFQKWHLNRLLTLLKVCAIKSAPPKKMSKKDMVSNYAALNAARRAKYHTKG